MMNTEQLDKSLPPIMYLWQDLVLYIGRLPPSVQHRNAVDILAIDLENPFSVSIDDGLSWDHCKSVFWPANQAHKSEYHDDFMAYLFIEPSSSNYSHFIKHRMRTYKRKYHINIDSEENTINQCIRIFNERADAQTSFSTLMSAVHPDINLAEHDDGFDQRVLSVINHIKINKDSFYIKELAQRVELSTSRLEHLFKLETGMSISRFRMWDKIKKFTKYMAKGKSITDAALEAGFSDASHFTRTFKYIIGFKPSLFYQAPNFTQIVVSDDY